MEKALTHILNALNLGDNFDVFGAIDNWGTSFIKKRDGRYQFITGWEGTQKLELTIKRVHRIAREDVGSFRWKTSRGISGEHVRTLGVVGVVALAAALKLLHGQYSGRRSDKRPRDRTT